MKPLEADFVSQHLSALLKLAHNTQSRAVAALVRREQSAQKAAVSELCADTGFLSDRSNLYVAPGIADGSPPIFLSDNEVDFDALVVRPLGWIEPQVDRDRLSDLILATPLLPSGGFVLCRIGEKDLLAFVEHLATQSLDASEIRCALASARVAGVVAGVDSGAEPTGWFDREVDNSVVEKIDQYLLRRANPWRRAPDFSPENPAWVCEGDTTFAALFDLELNVLVLTRSFRTFVGSPKSQMCARLLRANLSMVDGRFAALRDGAHGSIVLLNNLCCDDLDEIELARAVGYLENLSLRGAQDNQSGLELLGLLRRCRKLGSATPIAADESEAIRKDWPDSIVLGECSDGTKMELPVADFLTHAFVCGGSGSGKTIVCKGIVEQLAAAGVPSIVIDLKGDLSSLACVPEGVETEDIAKYLLQLHGESAPTQGDLIASLAKQSADNYQGSSISGEDLRAYRDGVEFRVLTPRSDIGIPLALSPLSGLDLGAIGESGGIVGDRALHELLDANLRGLVDYLNLPDVDSETLVAVLIQLLEAAHREGAPLAGIEGIERLVQLLFEVHDRTEKINFLATVDAIDEEKVKKYARAMNARLGGTFRYWFDGDELSIDELIAPRHGRIPINIINLSMLPSARDQGYAIAQINTQIIEWMRTQAGAQRPRLLYFIDEIAQGGGKEAIFPPHPYNPITKPGLNVLLKQGRAFGVSCLLATQNAKDIDYKGLGQCDTWLVGRLKTEKDIERLKMGIEASEATSTVGFSAVGKDALGGVGALDTGHFIVKTRNSGVKTYKQRWIQSLHDRMTPEMLRNWMAAEEGRVSNRIEEAGREWNHGDPRKAISSLETTITDEPYYSKLAEAKLMLCEWYFRMSEWSRVIDYSATLREAVQGRSGFELIHYYEGIAHFEMGALAPARASLERFVDGAAHGSGELIELCRARLADLYIKQDDYESLEETAGQSGEGKANRLVQFCRTMQSALLSWPSLRGGGLEEATVMAPADSESPDEVRYARKEEVCIRSYVAEIRRRLDDLPLAPPSVKSLSDEEYAQLERILVNIEEDAATEQSSREAVESALAHAEDRIDTLEFDAASDAIDEARKLVLSTGFGRQALEEVISLYRGACKAGENSVRNWLMEIDPFEFELEIASLFRNLGYEAQATKPTGDGGVDVWATRQNRRYVIQCKRYRKSIEPGQLREFATVIRNFDADEGIFVTTSTFTNGSREEAEKHGIHLMEMEDLVRLYSNRRIEGAARPAVPRSGRAPSRSLSQAVRPDCEAQVRGVLSASDRPFSMREVADTAGFSLEETQAAIGLLLAQGEVQKHGRGRGTRYTSNSGA